MKTAMHPIIRSLQQGITGVFLVTDKQVTFKPHMFSKPFQINLRDIEAVSDAYRVYLKTYLNVRTT